MSTEKPPHRHADLGQLSNSQYRRLLELVRPFEDACEYAADGHTLIDVSPFVPAADEPLFHATLCELVKIDLEYRWRHRHAARLEDYLARFPELGPADALPADLVHEEYRVRCRFGDGPPVEEYRERFPRQFAEFLWLAGPHVSPDAPANAPPTTEPARVFVDRYELRQELGRGGMGIVYKAYDRKHRRMVALKTMHDLDPAALLRFNNEFRSLVDLTHPNLVALYELAADGERRFFTMELVNGVNLLDHVRGVPAPGSDTAHEPATGKDGAAPVADLSPLTAEQAARLRHALRQLAEGILALHDAGKLHRDVKPSNVLVTAEGVVKLLDFGLAAELDHSGLYQSTEPHVLGTVAYMSPEQAATLPLSPAADWYAVGVMLFEALTGRLPFEGKPLEVLMQKRDRVAPAPGDLVADVPDDLNALAAGLLRRDPAARPSGRDVVARLGATPAEATAPAVGVAVPFVGREHQLHDLNVAFHDLLRGRASTVYVRGRSGVGKTALVQHFLDGVAGHDGAVVLRGRCYEQESVPFKALDSVIDSLGRFLRRQGTTEARAWLPRDVSALARVFPCLDVVPAVRTAPRRDLSAIDPQELRRRAVVALREMLARLGDQQPLVVAIDDLQWGDGDSAVLLRELTQPPDAPVMLLLGCYRGEDAETSPCLRVLLRPPESGRGIGWRELTVDDLTIEEGKELARALLTQAGAKSDARAEAIARESGGNPFFLCELAQSQSPDVSGENKALGEVLWARVVRLSDERRRLLEVVAVAGRTLRVEDACAAAGGESDLDDVAALRAGRLLRSAGPAEVPSVETYHDRIRESVVAHLPPDVARAHHRRLAEVLQSAGSTDFEALAAHCQAAALNKEAFHFASLAVEKAAQALAFGRAAEICRTALELSGPCVAAEDRRRLRVRLAEALANMGRGPEAGQEYLAAVPGAGPAEQRDLKRRAALQMLSGSQFDQGVAILEQVAAEMGFYVPAEGWRCLWDLAVAKTRLWFRGLRYRQRQASEVPPGLLAKVEVCYSVALGLVLVAPKRGAPLATRAVLLALEAGEPYHLAVSLLAEASYCGGVGGTRNARTRERLFELAHYLARQLDHKDPELHLQMTRAILECAQGRWAVASQLGDEVVALIRESPEWWSGMAQWALQHLTLRAMLHLGDVPEINRRLPQVLQEAAARNDLCSQVTNAVEIRTYALLAADQPDQARSELGPVMARWPRQGYHEQNLLHLIAECQIDLYQGQARQAWDRLTREWRTVDRSMLLVVQQLRIFMYHLRAAAALAVARTEPRPHPFWKTVRRDVKALKGEQADWATALALLLEAALAAQEGHRDRATAVLAEAAAAFRDTSMKLHEAAALRRLGRLRGSAAELAEGDRLMAEHGVVNADRMTALLAPGFADGP